MKIVTDSAADLPPAEIKELGINVAPLMIQFPEEEIQSEQITADSFYDRLKAMRPHIPTTAMPSIDMFARLYKQLAEKGEEILSIHVSSGLSGTFHVASQGAKQSGENVTMVDTMTLSGGERFQVLAAALAAKAGQGKEEILKLLERIRAATEVIYTLDTLEYLQRGGRIGRVQALASSVLNIKPVIKVDKADGKYSTAGKERTLKKALKAIQEYLETTYGNEPLWVCVLHGKFSEQAEELAALVQERLHVAKLEILRISPVLGVHTGPGIVGIAALPLALMADLL